MPSPQFKPLPDLTEANLRKIDERISPEPNSGCFIWLGATSTSESGTHQYGVISFSSHGGPYFKVSRLMYKRHYGIDPENLCVLHKCDNPICVNPTHLFLGTRRDNVDDMKRKGRAAKGDQTGSRLHPETLPRGEKSYTSKLTEKQVLEIRRLSASGQSQRILAEKFSVSPGCIQRIIERRSWTHI